MKSKTLTFFSCVAVIGLGLSLLLSDLDYFLTKKEDFGDIKIITIKKNTIYLEISFFNEFSKMHEISYKKLCISYMDELNKLDLRKASIFYTKWFNQVYIQKIKNPRLPILVVEFTLIIIGIMGLRKFLFPS